MSLPDDGSRSGGLAAPLLGFVLHCWSEGASVAKVLLSAADGARLGQEILDLLRGKPPDASEGLRSAAEAWWPRATGQLSAAQGGVGAEATDDSGRDASHAQLAGAERDAEGDDGAPPGDHPPKDGGGASGASGPPEHGERPFPPGQRRYAEYACSAAVAFDTAALARARPEHPFVGKRASPGSDEQADGHGQTAGALAEEPARLATEPLDGPSTDRRARAASDAARGEWQRAGRRPGSGARPAARRELAQEVAAQGAHDWAQRRAAAAEQNRRETAAVELQRHGRGLLARRARAEVSMAATTPATPPAQTRRRAAQKQKGKLRELQALNDAALEEAYQAQLLATAEAVKASTAQEELLGPDDMSKMQESCQGDQGRHLHFYGKEVCNGYVMTAYAAEGQGEQGRHLSIDEEEVSNGDGKSACAATEEQEPLGPDGESLKFKGDQGRHLHFDSTEGYQSSHLHVNGKKVSNGVSLRADAETEAQTLQNGNKASYDDSQEAEVARTAKADGTLWAKSVAGVRGQAHGAEIHAVEELTAGLQKDLAAAGAQKALALKDAADLAMELIREEVEARTGIALGAFNVTERAPARNGLAAAVRGGLSTADLVQRWIEALTAHAGEAGRSRAPGSPDDAEDEEDGDLMPEWRRVEALKKELKVAKAEVATADTEASSLKASALAAAERSKKAGQMNESARAESEAAAEKLRAAKAIAAEAAARLKEAEEASKAAARESSRR
ncbi:unnamed protein product [Prorocentrum cordatum]|uniref:Uncharacterized protein n=1 Tax=Prorocentrum cordatum TaxID=2364126 RepID=A0ABN9WSG8_9DINO|nr:unnamed protein product [Polarella glacialis]